MARRRRAYYASQAREAPGVGEGWARPGWGEGFGAPKSERSEWNGEGWRERVVLGLGVVVRWGPFLHGVLLTGVFGLLQDARGGVVPDYADDIGECVSPELPSLDFFK
jgi:hypothetical protein